VFRRIVAPSFSACECCGIVLAGLRCWEWLEDERLRRTCCVCMFREARLSRQVAA
jgi:hypothetical protein